MKLYNSLTRKKEELTPISKKVVSMYVCGPTVYNTPTLGNLRTYLNTDFLRRAIKYLGYGVNEVINITDIEDKIIRDSNKLKIPYTELTEKYEKIFLANLCDLNIELPEHMPKATEEIPEMIQIIEKLLADGYAYQTDDGSVYFSIAKFKDYGKLSGLDKRELKSGTRMLSDEYEKDNAQDFALWKAAKTGEPSWEAPFGRGRPGWHIECTAMSIKYLGETIDIHAGGIDLLFPHHENEIAQSEAYTGKKFVSEWFHCDHLLINGERMGKSLNNFYTLSDLQTKFGVHPLAFRLLAASSHYREKLNLTEESLKSADITLKNLYTDILRIKSGAEDGESRLTKEIKKAELEFENALSDDLSMPKALSELFKLLNSSNKTTKGKYRKSESGELIKFLNTIDTVLGLNFDSVKFDVIPDKVQELAKEREHVRDLKDFAKSDELRAKIEKLGFSVEDTEDGPIIRKK
jgi:cysteinyl-tRNA synthetase